MKTDEILLIAALGIGAYLVLRGTQTKTAGSPVTGTGNAPANPLNNVSQTTVSDIWGLIFGSGGNSGSTNSGINTGLGDFTGDLSGQDLGLT